MNSFDAMLGEIAILTLSDILPKVALLNRMSSGSRQFIVVGLKWLARPIGGKETVYIAGLFLMSMPIRNASLQIPLNVLHPPCSLASPLNRGNTSLHAVLASLSARSFTHSSKPFALAISEEVSARAVNNPRRTETASARPVKS